MIKGYHYDLIAKKMIQKKIASVSKTKLLDIFYFDDPQIIRYYDAIKQMARIEYPVSMEINLSHDPIEVIEKIYIFKQIETTRFKWLIPSFDSSKWWIYVEVSDVKEFFECILKDNLFQETIVDLNFNFIFDSTVNDNDMYSICIFDLNKK